MNIFSNILNLLWRLWFYFWVFTTIIITLPILILVISKESRYPFFYKIAHIWAKVILFIMGFSPKVYSEEKMLPDQSYVFSPNHTSIVDIMLMLAISKNPFVFLGKKELANIPIFGYVYKRTCILVDRNNTKSRNQAFYEAKKRLKNGLSVCIFPEGKVPDDESIVLDYFHNGAFRLAIEFQIPLVPITFYDCKKRFPFNTFKGSPGKLRVKIHHFLYTDDLTIKDRNTLKNKTFNIIYEELKIDLDKKYSKTFKYS
ncbi:MAG: lysophospholipid acyltransferase family protein [Bacteroidota bacterium]